ncbi:hypothetical protein Q0Z83_064870 [Actinoplanes sichuanensis]|uniref:Secreted protein n=1 Tax=Actinoplanes sichuanensis TaxID=512349 RepID=A0ABW4ALU0_9ACTN|nr:hypothetical protein [Actinoplanes sichuanensis]BEL08296.1 hypothetical protein Q0Z83_064870 [Actinoplanes sichuanensis]
MRKITLAAAATAAVVVSGSPAAAGPPTLTELRAALLTAAEAPTGYRVAEAPQNMQLPIPLDRTLCDDDTSRDGEPETTLVVESLEEDGGTSVFTGIAAPGAFNARAFVTAVEKTPVRCPKENGSTLTPLTLPALGDAAAGFRDVKPSVDGTSSESTVVAVADGELVLLFEMSGGDESDRAEFLTLVAAAVGKAGRLPGQFSAA